MSFRANVYGCAGVDNLVTIFVGEWQGRAQEGAKVARATACLPSLTKVENIYIFLNSISAAELHVGLDKIITEYVRGGKGLATAR